MPAGRPKGSTADRIWAQALRRAVLDRPKKGGPRNLDLIAIGAVKAAIDGKMDAVKEIGDRIDGKVPQALTDATGGPITVKIVA